MSASRRVVAEGTRLEIEAAFPGGAPHLESESSVDVALTTRPQGGASREARATLSYPGPVSLSDVFADTAQGDALVRVGASTTNLTVRVAPSVRAALLRAREVLTPLDSAFMGGPWLTPPGAPRATATLPAGSIWSVERTAERLAELVAEGDSDATHLASEASLLASLLDDVSAGRDPYARRAGAMRRAYRSPLDGSLQEYSVFVPASYRATTA